MVDRAQKINGKSVIKSQSPTEYGWLSVKRLTGFEIGSNHVSQWSMIY